MLYLKKIQKYLKDPVKIGIYFVQHYLHGMCSDETFLKILYKDSVGKPLDLKNPTTFNEKLQWSKLHDRKDVYTVMVDKYAAKQYVAERVGDRYVIPTLGVWDKFDEIDFEKLPDQFVLKTNHDCGGVIICKDKSQLDVKAAKKKLNRALKRNYFWHTREWPYKNVRRRIFAEEFMQDSRFDVLTVYKIFNFSGQPKIIQVILNDKTPQETVDYFDTDWNLLDLRQYFRNSECPLSKPDCLDEMLELAHALSKDKPGFLRTDFYEIDGKIYFSEFTFFSDAGLGRFDPEEWDTVLGSWLELPDQV